MNKGPSGAESESRKSADQYNYHVEKAIRGREAATRAKLENEGWEFIAQTQGTLRSELTFRQLKPEPPKTLASYLQQGWTTFRGLTPKVQQIVLAGGGGVVLILVIVGVVAAQRGDEPEPGASQTEATDQPNKTPSEEPSDEPSLESSEEPSEEPSEQGPETLTVEDQDFAALLASGRLDYKAHRAFVRKYRDRTIEFDGCIAFMMAHGDYETRFDALVFPGDYNKQARAPGPGFTFIDVNYYDFNLIGSKTPDEVSEGQNHHFLATVEDWDSESRTIKLHPVSTELR